MIATRFDNVPYAAERTRFHLTPEQVNFFDDNGYLILRNWIPADLLARLQAAGDAWIEQGWRYQGTPSGDADLDDYHFADRPSGRVMFRVNYLHSKQQSASLELLGSPQVLAVAESLCGRNFVPTYESMVFKEERDGAPIVWHQDAVHPRRYRIFNFDLYLDRSTVQNGALRVLAGWQHQKQDPCQIADRWGWNPPTATVVEMEPGDVLLHDVMVPHGSPEVEGNSRRRTIYYEFRAAEQILDEGPWDRSWIDRRLRLIPLALEAHAQAFPEAEPFAWSIDDAWRPASSGDREHELRIVHEVHTAGAWCSAGSVPAK
jgi:ectoine hydroxylase-related dioxygenase (phytanoyl-CoA dioxygenase family)